MKESFWTSVTLTLAPTCSWFKADLRSALEVYVTGMEGQSVKKNTLRIVSRARPLSAPSPKKESRFEAIYT